MRIYDITNPVDRVAGKVLAAQAAHIGDQVWLITDDRKISFAQADSLVTRYASGLAAAGVVQGQTLAIVMAPSIEAVLIALAAGRIGAIFVNITTEYRGDFLSGALDQAGAEVAITDGDLLARFQELPSMGRYRQLFVNGTVPSSAPQWAKPLDTLLDHGDTLPVVDVRWTDPCQVWFSSGTTGKPKGVVRSHGSNVWLGARFDRGHRPGDVLYSCTPVYGGAAWAGAIWPALVQGLSVGLDSRFSVSGFWDRTRLYGATHIFTVGAMHMLLNGQPETPQDADNPVRHGYCVPFPFDLVPAFKRRFGIERMDQSWGQSETMPAILADDDGTPWRNGAIGRAAPYYDVKLLDNDDVEVPTGEVGEICLRPLEPGLLFLGYLDAPDVTVASWRNLWHHSGDMAYRDEQGIFYFADRKKDYIRYKGRSLAMFEVEDVISRHPEIIDVAAFGIKSAELESEFELMISVVRAPGSSIDATALARHINDVAPYYFVPRYIDFADVLPRNAQGKLTKNELKERGVTADTWDRHATDFTITR